MVELLLIEMVIRLLAAAVIGAVIGLERELHGITAGFRTNAIVCIGAALFTLASLQSLQFSSLAPATDVTRVAAGIVTGVGFLGAGVIFSDRKGVHGLTTAANIWTVAALGLLSGMGEFGLAIVATAVILCIIVAGKEVENRFLSKRSRL